MSSFCVMKCMSSSVLITFSHSNSKMSKLQSLLMEKAAAETNARVANSSSAARLFIRWTLTLILGGRVAFPSHQASGSPFCLRPSCLQISNFSSVIFGSRAEKVQALLVPSLSLAPSSSLGAECVRALVWAAAAREVPRARSHSPLAPAPACLPACERAKPEPQPACLHIDLHPRFLW